jgi:hypothetical protein
LYANFTLYVSEYMMSQFSIYEWLEFGCPNDCDDDVCLFKLACSWIRTVVCVKFHSFQQRSSTMFVGIISVKPSRDFTRPLRMHRGLKSMLHMLNAIVSPMKHDLCFMLSFYFVKGLTKCKFRGFCWVPNIVYLSLLI